MHRLTSRGKGKKKKEKKAPDAGSRETRAQGQGSARLAADKMIDDKGRKKKKDVSFQDANKRLVSYTLFGWALR